MAARPDVGAPFWRPVAGGAALGLLGMALPLVLFSGQPELHELLRLAAERGPMLMVLLALACAVCVAAGWLGRVLFLALKSARGRVAPTSFRAEDLGESLQQRARARGRCHGQGLQRVAEGCADRLLSGGEDSWLASPCGFSCSS